MIFVQARTGSARLPGKVLMEIEGRRMIDRVIQACLETKAKHQVVVLLPDSDRGSDLHEVVCRWEANGVKLWFGSEDDVASRFQGAFRMYGELLDEEDASCGLIRVCADRPFLQPSFLDELDHEKYPEPLLYNHAPFGEELGPTGLGAESIAKFLAFELFDVSSEAILSKEHVTLNLYSNDSVPRHWVPPAWLPKNFAGRFDVDESTDLDLANVRQDALVAAGLQP